MRKRNFADALYVGPDVTFEEVLDLFWPDRPDDDRFGFHAHPTKSGNRLFIPVMRFELAVQGAPTGPDQLDLPKEGGQPAVEMNPKIYVGNKTCQWPILPVHEYRGGYMTATARAAVELAHQPYFTTEFEYIERPLTEVYHQRGIYVDGKQVDTRGWTEMVRGKYIRTKHKVLYVDRVKGFIIVDSLLRPEAEDAS
jgi:hypothetical protein